MSAAFLTLLAATLLSQLTDILKDLSGGTISLLTGGLAATCFVVMLLMYRLYLHHADVQDLRLNRGPSTSMHTALQHQLARVDRWGAVLTGGLFGYAILVLAYLIFQSLDRISQVLLRLLRLF